MQKVIYKEILSFGMIEASCISFSVNVRDTIKD